MISINMPKKPNFNKRLKSFDDEKKRRKKNEGFITTSFTIEEILDESGEVLDDTIIKFSFGGILIYMSIANSMKLSKTLNDVLNFKNKS